jgi:hypothetical protein
MKNKKAIGLTLVGLLVFSSIGNVAQTVNKNSDSGWSCMML